MLLNNFCFRINNSSDLVLYQSINQTVNNVLFFMLARVRRLDPQQLLHLSLSNGSTLCIPYSLISHFIHCSGPCLLRSAPTPEPLTSDTLTPSNCKTSFRFALFNIPVMYKYVTYHMRRVEPEYANKKYRSLDGPLSTGSRSSTGYTFYSYLSSVAESVLSVVRHVADIPAPALAVIVLFVYLQIFCALWSCTRSDPNLSACLWPLYLYRIVARRFGNSSFSVTACAANDAMPPHKERSSSSRNGFLVQPYNL